MNLRYDEDFVEAAVFLCARGERPGIPPAQVARFHRERERAYALLDPDERNNAFFQVHLAWFREWNLEQDLTSPLEQLPLLCRTADLLVFRQARHRTDEGAELYVNPAGQRAAVVALRPERFKNSGALGDFLRHEFLHLHDMLDPEFGYEPHLRLPGGLAAQERLVRERYRLLWDITIDGRLTRAGHRPSATPEQHRAALARAFPVWPEEKHARTFECLFSDTAPRHANLAKLAADPRDLAHNSQPLPGASCPLCGFPAFDWVQTPSIPREMSASIQAEFPHWGPSQGLCGRCFEIFQARAAGLAMLEI